MGKQTSLSGVVIEYPRRVDLVKLWEETKSNMSMVRVRQIRKQLETDNAALRAKVQWLVDELARNHQLEEPCFTFPDGDTWYVSGHEPKPEALEP